MARNSNKREKLMSAARDLIHQQGYRHTTLADIAKQSDVPLGNVYYYFRTKEDLATAVIQERAQSIVDQTEFLNREYAEPKQRVLAFLDYAEGEKESLVESGCPIGSLCQELNKESGVLTGQASEMLQGMLGWFEEQFRQIGVENPSALAMEFICSIQGIALMANSLKNGELVSEQIDRWRKKLNEL